MLKVGLTGGIGSGKSTVSRLLASYGAVIIDADLIARRVVEPGTPGLRAVVDEFGGDVLRPDGSLDRDKLAEVVFHDPDRLQRLNAIVHPLVGEEMAAQERDAGPDAIVVHDVALLVENAMMSAYDVVVVVAASPQTQVARLMTDRGMTREAAEARIASQLPVDAKRAAADVVIENDGTRAELEQQVRSLWERLAQRREEIVRGAP